MDVTIAESGPCRRTLSIKISPDRVRAHVDEMFATASRQVTLKGFRPGKVPRRVLEQKFGDEILLEAKESLINRTFEEALRTHSLTPLGQPSLEGVDSTPLDQTAPFEYRVHIDVRPEFELGNVRDLEIERGNTQVTEADVDAALAHLAAEKRTLRSINEPIQDGDFVKMDLRFSNEQGEVVSERAGVQLNTNIPIAGADPEAFAARLRGAEAGQELDLELVFPETFDKPEVRGQKGSVRMKLVEVLRVTPAPIDDALAKSYDFESLQALREDLERRLREQRLAADKRRQEEDLIAQLLAEHPFDIPASMVEDQVKHMLANFAERLKQSGADEAEVEKRVSEAENEAKQEAERRVRTFFLLGAVAKKERIFVTEGDIDLELREIAAQNHVSVGEVRQHYESNRLLPDLRLGLMERKVRDFLREHAKLTD
jgi:trigger factor